MEKIKTNWINEADSSIYSSSFHSHEHDDLLEDPTINYHLTFEQWNFLSNELKSEIISIENSLLNFLSGQSLDDESLSGDVIEDGTLLSKHFSNDILNTNQFKSLRLFLNSQKQQCFSHSFFYKALPKNCYSWDMSITGEGIDFAFDGFYVWRVKKLDNNLYVEMINNQTGSINYTFEIPSALSPSKIMFDGRKMWLFWAAPQNGVIQALWMDGINKTKSDFIYFSPTFEEPIDSFLVIEDIVFDGEYFLILFFQKSEVSNGFFRFDPFSSLSGSNSVSGFRVSPNVETYFDKVVFANKKYFFFSNNRGKSYHCKWIIWFSKEDVSTSHLLDNYTDQQNLGLYYCDAIFDGDFIWFIPGLEDQGVCLSLNIKENELSSFWTSFKDMSFDKVVFDGQRAWLINGRNVFSFDCFDKRNLSTAIVQLEEEPFFLFDSPPSCLIFDGEKVWSDVGSFLQIISAIPYGEKSFLKGVLFNEDISNSSLGAVKFADGSITSDKLAPNSLTVNKFADGSFEGRHFTDSNNSFDLNVHLPNRSLTSDSITFPSKASATNFANNSINRSCLADEIISPLSLNNRSLALRHFSLGSIRGEKLNVEDSSSLATVGSSSGVLERKLTSGECFFGPIPELLLVIQVTRPCFLKINFKLKTDVAAGNQPNDYGSVWVVRNDNPFLDDDTLSFPSGGTSTFYQHTGSNKFYALGDIIYVYGGATLSGNCVVGNPLVAYVYDFELHFADYCFLPIFCKEKTFWLAEGV